jgi:hypothetical protein
MTRHLNYPAPRPGALGLGAVHDRPYQNTKRAPRIFNLPVAGALLSSSVEDGSSLKGDLRTRDGSAQAGTHRSVQGHHSTHYFGVVLPDAHLGAVGLRGRRRHFILGC